MRIALFVTCLDDTLYPETGRATVEVLERLGHAVVFPTEQTCCGQLHSNSGYRDEALVLVRRPEKIFGGYDAVVSPSSSCVGHVRDLAPALAPTRGAQAGRYADADCAVPRAHRRDLVRDRRLGYVPAADRRAPRSSIGSSPCRGRPSRPRRATTVRRGR